MQQVSVSITAHVNGLFELLVMRFSISGLDVFAILSVLKEKVYILKGKKKVVRCFLSSLRLLGMIVTVLSNVLEMGRGDGSGE